MVGEWISTRVETENEENEEKGSDIMERNGMWTKKNELKWKKKVKEIMKKGKMKMDWKRKDWVLQIGS